MGKTAISLVLGEMLRLDNIDVLVVLVNELLYEQFNQEN